jgi:putative heme transporter
MPGMGTPPERSWVRRSRPWWRPVRIALSFALLGVAVWVVAGKSSELSGASVFLTQLRWGWLALAAVAETLSYILLAQLQRRLAGAGGTWVPIGRAAQVAVAGSAIQGALPVGAAFAGVYEFRQYQFMGADDVLAGFVVVGSGVVAFATLAGLAGVGLGLAASLGTAYDLGEAIIGVVCVAILVLLAWNGRTAVYRYGERATARAERICRRPPGRWAGPLTDALERVRAVAPGSRDLGMAALASASSWLADCMCLALSFMAVGADVPWQGLLLAYCGGQLAVNLPITPGGLGVVEGSLTVALVTFGGAEASTVAAVLLYRVLSFWLPLPVGGGTYLALARRRRREERDGPSPEGQAAPFDAGARPAVEAGDGPIAAPAVEEVQNDEQGA